MRRSNFLCPLIVLVGLLLATPFLTTTPLLAQELPSCDDLPSHAELAQVLREVVEAGNNSGFGFHMWATLVDRDGIVCAVAFSGEDRGDQWPGSRVISAQKANTANAFSLPNLALSTANLYSAVQPGGTLYGLQFSNPVDTAVAYGGPAGDFGLPTDPMVGQRIGGINIFGGGLALYDATGTLLGALGVSGDTSCADHIIAWRVRDALGLDYIPGGVSPTGDDNIVFDIAANEMGQQASAGGWGHPACGLGEVEIAETLPETLPEAEGEAFEVWALDQADTHADGGGLLYIWSSADLTGDDPSSATPEVIDLAQAAMDAGCPVAKRPHMMLANYSDPPTHVVIANVGSGDTFFVDGASRQIVGCVRTVGGFGGVGGSASSHNASTTPDNRIVLVDDMGASGESGFLHKIEADFETNTYTLVETLPLAPFAAELGTELARPICHEFTSDSRFAYVTMGGGGVLVVDMQSSPMEVVHVYPAAMVPGIGCGAFRLPGDRMITNGESGPAGGDDFLYIFDTAGAADGSFPDPVQIELPGEDTHGLAVCTDADGNEYALTMMRVSNDVTIVDLQSHEVIDTISLVRPFSPNPTPDLSELVGNQVFVTLRGAKPLTAIPDLVDAERTPGVAVLSISEDCHSFEWDENGWLPMMENPNTVAVDGQEVSAADPHGLEVVFR